MQGIESLFIVSIATKSAKKYDWKQYCFERKALYQQPS